MIEAAEMLAYDFGLKSARRALGVSRAAPRAKEVDYFYLYVIRYAAGLAGGKLIIATLAQRLIKETCDKQLIEPGQLAIHEDRGSSVKPRPAALSPPVLESPRPTAGPTQVMITLFPNLSSRPSNT